MARAPGGLDSLKLVMVTASAVSRSNSQGNPSTSRRCFGGKPRSSEEQPRRFPAHRGESGPVWPEKGSGTHASEVVFDLRRGSFKRQPVRRSSDLDRTLTSLPTHVSRACPRKQACSRTFLHARSVGTVCPANAGSASGFRSGVDESGDGSACGNKNEPPAHAQGVRRSESIGRKTAV